MLMKQNAERARVLLMSVSLCALTIAAQLYPSISLAQDATQKKSGAKDEGTKDPTVSNSKPTSPSATVNLVNLLVEQGIIKEEQADSLIKQAEGEAYVSRQAAKDATAKADDASKAASAASAAASPPGSKHITYVPEIVRQQLRDQLRAEIMEQAKEQNWASPGTYPEWASRIKMYGDFRARYEGQFFPQGGYNAPGFITNFNAINTGSAYDVTKAPIGLPSFDSNADRDRVRLRARVGMDVNLFNGFTAGVRFASGDSNSPVSTNQTLGGTGGDFSKYAAWIDRAFVKYQTPNDDAVISVGRFDNPFFAATDLVWYSELGFDGAAVQLKHEVQPGFAPFFVAGAFPIFNTDLNFATGDAVKFQSEDKYLFGAQAGFKARIEQRTEWTVGLSYFDFYNVKGALSDPCDVSVATGCSTDSLRPSFAQKGNTYMRLRNIVAPVSTPTGFPQPQYFGLAGDYTPLVASSRLDFGQFDPAHVILDAEYVRNTSFNRETFAAANNGLGLSVENNLKPMPDGTTGPFEGGGTGWMTRLTVGHKKMEQFGDWSVHAAYKYLESDATVDSFVDSDFGLGGTNLKGYIVGGNFAFSQNVWMTARWLSATSIAGAPYAVDVVQVDLNAKF